MRVARLFLGLIVAATVATASQAAVPEKAELIGRAAAGANACADAMPSIKALGPQLAKAGFKLREANGQFRVCTDSSNRVVVGVTSQSQNGTRAKAGCIVAVHRMTEGEAQQLIQPWIKISKAKPIPPEGKNSRWLGKFKGGPIILGIKPRADIDFIQGAAIVALSPN